MQWRSWVTSTSDAVVQTAIKRKRQKIVRGQIKGYLSLNAEYLAIVTSNWHNNLAILCTNEVLLC